MLPHDPEYVDSGQLASGAAEEAARVRAATATRGEARAPFAEVGLECGRGLVSQGRLALLASLAEEAKHDEVCARAREGLLCRAEGEVRGFTGPGAGRIEELEQGAIPNREGGRPLRRGEEGLDLGLI